MTSLMFFILYVTGGCCLLVLCGLAEILIQRCQASYQRRRKQRGWIQRDWK